MAYKRKTVDSFQVWTNYGYGWEHETTERTLKLAREMRRTYLENVPGINIKIVCKREPIGFWKDEDSTDSPSSLLLVTN